MKPFFKLLKPRNQDSGHVACQKYSTLRKNRPSINTHMLTYSVTRPNIIVLRYWAGILLYNVPNINQRLGLNGKIAFLCFFLWFRVHQGGRYLLTGHSSTAVPVRTLLLEGANYRSYYTFRVKPGGLIS
jgi:hypothetical protein